MRHLALVCFRGRRFVKFRRSLFGNHCVDPLNTRNTANQHKAEMFTGMTRTIFFILLLPAILPKDRIHVMPTAAAIADPRNQSQDSPNATPTPKEERELEDRIPKHLPIRIKIKKEKQERFKDLTNEHWARDLEIEVTNIGERDIYFLSLGLFLPEIKSADGKDISFPLYYGREELANLPAKARSDDTPIKPGETFVFKLLENNVLGYEAFNRELKRMLPKRVVLRFRMLNFGDGTGLEGWDGTFFPRGSDKTYSKCSDPEGGREDPSIFELLPSRPFRTSGGRAVPPRCYFPVYPLQS
jgi:hypothetical protein